jgi:AGCS family alanine or glycine:cation symporter
VQVADDNWSLDEIAPPARTVGTWADDASLFVIVAADPNPVSGNNLHRLDGSIVVDAAGARRIRWSTINSSVKPVLNGPEVYGSYVGATMTAKAFDSVTPGLGKWLITLSVWLFAISTCISWSYYGEQSIIFLAGERAVLPYKLVFCTLTIVATLGFLKTDAQLDNLTGVGTGVMLFVNVPIMWFMGRQAMLAYKDYIKRLKTGRMGPEHPPPTLEDLISGRDVEK